MVDNNWLQAKEERWRQTLSLQEQFATPRPELVSHRSLHSQPVPTPIPQQPLTPVKSPLQSQPNPHSPPFQPNPHSPNFQPNPHSPSFQPLPPTPTPAPTSSFQTLPPAPTPAFNVNPDPSPIPNLKTNTPYVIITHDDERPENAPIDFTQLQPAENETQIDALFLSGGITNVINLVPKLKRRFGMLQDQATQTDEIQVTENNSPPGQQVDNSPPGQQVEKKDENDNISQQQIVQKGGVATKMDTKQVDDLLKRLFAQSIQKVPDEKKISSANSNNLKQNNNKKQNQKVQQKTDTKNKGKQQRQQRSRQERGKKNNQSEKEKRGEKEKEKASPPPSVSASTTQKDNKNQDDQILENQSEKSVVSSKGMSAINNIMATLCGEEREEEINQDAQKSNALWTC